MPRQGWYLDPESPGFRWWNQSWTDHVITESGDRQQSPLSTVRGAPRAIPRSETFDATLDDVTVAPPVISTSRSRRPAVEKPRTVADNWREWPRWLRTCLFAAAIVVAVVWVANVNFDTSSGPGGGPGGGVTRQGDTGIDTSKDPLDESIDMTCRQQRDNWRSEEECRDFMDGVLGRE